MKKLSLHESRSFTNEDDDELEEYILSNEDDDELEEYILSNEDSDVCAGKLISCLHNLKELELRLNISPDLKSKLRIRGDAVKCKVVFINET